jgi:hypothetical protein
MVRRYLDRLRLPLVALGGAAVAVAVMVAYLQFSPPAGGGRPGAPPPGPAAAAAA